MIQCLLDFFQATSYSSYEEESGSGSADSGAESYDSYDSEGNESFSSASVDGEESAETARSELNRKCAPKITLTAKQKKHVHGWGYDSWIQNDLIFDSNTCFGCLFCFLPL